MGNWADGHNNRDEKKYEDSSVNSQTLYELYPRRESDILGSMQDFCDKLQNIVASSGMDPTDRFNIWSEQQKNLAMSYRLSNEMLTNTKLAIHALKFDPKTVWEYIECLTNGYKKMVELRLPEDISWQFKCEVGAEIVEVMFVQNLFHALFFGRVPFSPPTPKDLNVPPQAYLAGIADASGELGKLLQSFLVDCEVPLVDQKKFEMRFHDIYRTLNAFLNQFEAVYGRVINNSRRPGYGNTYRGMLGRMREMIVRHQERVLRVLDSFGDGEVPAAE